MKQVTTIGLDIAKSVFLVHGVDAAERVVLGQKLSRSGVVKVTEVGRWRGVSWSNPRKAKGRLRPPVLLGHEAVGDRRRSSGFEG